jgi:hypothetical protein
MRPAGTAATAIEIRSQTYAVADHIEAERDAFAQGIGEGRDRSDESIHKIVPRPDAQQPKARRLAGRVPPR